MMIELNKRTYMNESGELDSERARKVIASLREVYETILGKT
jgi:N-formylglutamate amidohydrolase